MPALLRWGWIAPTVVITLLSLRARPLLPADETRYLAVAWEMWRDGQWLVPLLNGEPYSHKPPLLFWLIHAGWWAFGVNEWWPRLLPGLAALVCGALTRRLALRLFASQPAVADIAPWVLAGTLYWLGYSAMLMFDLLATVFVLAGWLAVLRWRDGAGYAFLQTALALGIGALAKGPVVFLFVVPAILLARRPRESYARAALRAAAATATGMAISLLWALSAIAQSTPAYAEAILWNQSAGRALHAFSHGRPWWWYLPMLVLLWLPWSLTPVFWRSLVSSARESAGGAVEVRFCAGVAAISLATLSAISGKQPHYLLPIYPLLAILLARTLLGMSEPRRVQAALPLAAFGLLAATLPFTGDALAWAAQVSIGPGLALAGVAALGLLLRLDGPAQAMVTAGLVALTLATALLTVAPHAFATFDLRALSREIAAQQAQREVAFAGIYRGQFTFLGRLQRPLPTVPHGEVRAWLQRHPDGLVVGEIRGLDSAEARAVAWTAPYRSRHFAGWTATSLAAVPDALPPSTTEPAAPDDE